jgi:hypothetical protein
MSTDNLSSQIQAAGRTIMLSTGNEITIRYGMAALVEIEKQYGSVNGLVKVLNEAENGSLFTVLSHVLWAGSSRKVPLAAFLDMLDPKLMKEYSEAFGEALSESVGSGDSQGEAAAVK